MNHPPRRIPSADRPPLQSKRLLDQLRERIRYLHYSLKTEEAYLFWSRAYIRFHGVRHPKDMGATEVEAFLTHLTNARRVSVSTHKQALSARLFLYREVLGVDLPWMNEMARPTAPRRIPSVLTIEGVAALLSRTEGETGLLARLLYGTGTTRSPLDALLAA
jgi:site-specific recombinase XerD